MCSRLAERELHHRRVVQQPAPTIGRSARRRSGRSLTSLLLRRRNGSCCSSGFHFSRPLLDQPQTLVAGVGPVPCLLAASCRFLTSEPALSAEGLFRVEGARPRLLLLRARLDADRSCGIPADTPPQDVCSTLKAWLRQLPQPLLTSSMAEALAGAAADAGGEAKRQAIRAAADGGCQARSLRLLCLLLHRLAAAGFHGNRMNAASLATCLGPCLYGGVDNAEAAARLNLGVALLIRCAQDIPDADYQPEAQPPNKLHQARSRPRSVSRIREAVLRAVASLGSRRSRSRSRSSASLLQLPRQPELTAVRIFAV